MSKILMNSATETKSRFGGKLKALAALGLLAASLTGCVVYPNGGYYGGGYGYGPPAYYAPPVAFDFGFGGGYYGHRGWR